MRAIWHTAKRPSAEAMDLSGVMERVVILWLLLVSAGCCDRERIPQFMGDLYSAEAHVRNQATLELSRCGSDAAGAVPRLGQMLYDHNPGVQSGAAYALTRIGTAEADAIMEKAMAAKRSSRTAD